MNLQYLVDQVKKDTGYSYSSINEVKNIVFCNYPSNVPETLVISFIDRKIYYSRVGYFLRNLNNAKTVVDLSDDKISKISDIFDKNEISKWNNKYIVEDKNLVGSYHWYLIIELKNGKTINYYGKGLTKGNMPDNFIQVKQELFEIINN